MNLKEKMSDITGYMRVVPVVRNVKHNLTHTYSVDWQLLRAQKEDTRVIAEELRLAPLNDNNILRARMVRQFYKCSQKHQITFPSCHCLTF